jgi:hypothetical protein
MRLTKIYNFQDYCHYRDNNQKFYKKAQAIEFDINKQLENKAHIYINGYSWPIQKESKFLVDKLYSNNNVANLRERLVCKNTELNNRIRGSIHIFEDYFKARTTDSIYLTEQCTMLGKWMQKKYKKNIECSEYLAECSSLKKVHLQTYILPNKLRHQDLTNLTFKNNSFDFVLSFDCFEHIPDYKAAFKECLRVLKPKGKIIWSVPFDRNRYETLVRAKVNADGSIKHLTEPEYHGNPTSADGCLSFYTYGWELLNELRKIGYSKTYAILYWSEKYAYLGEEQILLCAEK